MKIRRHCSVLPLLAALALGSCATTPKPEVVVRTIHGRVIKLSGTIYGSEVIHFTSDRVSMERAYKDGTPFPWRRPRGMEFNGEPWGPGETPAGWPRLSAGLDLSKGRVLKAVGVMPPLPMDENAIPASAKSRVGRDFAIAGCRPREDGFDLVLSQPEILLGMSPAPGMPMKFTVTVGIPLSSSAHAAEPHAVLRTSAE